MPACCVGHLALWPLLFTAIVVMVCITMSTYESSEFIFYLGGLMAFFFIWIAIYMVCLIRYEERDHNTPEDEMIREFEGFGEFEANEISSPRERVARFVIGNVMAQRRQYSQGTRLVMPFGRSAQIARLAMRALPPVKSFTDEDKIDGSQSADDCPICMEGFKKGELIQPFGLCVHEFHSSCLNSWLHGGKTTCPLCRKDLAASIHARGT